MSGGGVPRLTAVSGTEVKHQCPILQEVCQ